VRIVLTGAAGFVGAETLRQGIAAGHEMIALVRPGDQAPRLTAVSGQFRREDVDLGESAALASLLASVRPQAVIHCAWSGVANAHRFDRRQITDNVETSCALVEAAGTARVEAFIGMGSQGEYGAGNAMLETGLPEPTTLYGAAKVAALFLTRQLAAQAGMRHAWLRLFSAYGPGDNDGWLIPMLITEMLGGRRPRTTLGTQYWDWLHVADVASALLAAATTGAAEGVFNLGSGRAVQVRRVVEMIRDLAAPGMELVFGEVPFRPDQVTHMQADISRLTAATGWAPRIAIEDGLARTVAWHRQLSA
jgi:UDP-glucose 4-epimerase